MYWVVGVILTLVWLYFLRVFRKSELPAWHYIWGSCGLFILMMVYVRPYFTQPLAQVVAVVAGAFGKMTGMFSAYFKYGVLFIDTSSGAISLLIDFECSGILEILAFLALLIFFRAYTKYERVVVGILGIIYIILANALRIIVICSIIYIWGADAYSIAHTYVGRLVFYSLSVLLYFYVFTKTQIIRQKVGGFTYGNNK